MLRNSYFDILRHLEELKRYWVFFVYKMQSSVDSMSKFACRNFLTIC